MRALEALVSCEVPNLYFPLMCLIDYLGVRLICVSVIPGILHEHYNEYHPREQPIDKAICLYISCVIMHSIFGYFNIFAFGVVVEEGDVLL